MSDLYPSIHHANTFFLCSSAKCCVPQGTLRAKFSSLQMQHYGAFRDGRCSGTGIARILRDPVACCTSAFVSTGLILADSDRATAVSGADKRIVHEALNRSDDLFHFRLVFLDNVKELFR